MIFLRTNTVKQFKLGKHCCNIRLSITTNTYSQTVLTERYISDGARHSNMATHENKRSINDFFAGSSPAKRVKTEYNDASASCVIPDVENISSLVEMGFSEKQASMALVENDNDVGKAIEWCLDNPIVDGDDEGGRERGERGDAEPISPPPTSSKRTMQADLSQYQTSEEENPLKDQMEVRQAVLLEHVTGSDCPIGRQHILQTHSVSISDTQPPTVLTNSNLRLTLQTRKTNKRPTRSRPRLPRTLPCQNRSRRPLPIPSIQSTILQSRIRHQAR